MSSHINSNHHNSHMCPSCGKGYSEFPYNLFEKFNSQEDFKSFDSLKDHHSIKPLLSLLINLLIKLDDKWDHHNQHHCKCYKHDKKHKSNMEKSYAWDMFEIDEKHHYCKCGKHRGNGHESMNDEQGHYTQNWKKETPDDMFEKNHAKCCKYKKHHYHHCECKKHDDKHDKHHYKCKKHHECPKCKCKYYSHMELHPQIEDAKYDDSSGYENYSNNEKYYAPSYCSCKRSNYDFLHLESSSSKEMKEKYVE
nr:hypothetical protein [Lysinibacillus timonensis]